MVVRVKRVAPLVKVVIPLARRSEKVIEVAGQVVLDINVADVGCHGGTDAFGTVVRPLIVVEEDVTDVGPYAGHQSLHVDAFCGAN